MNFHAASLSILWTTASRIVWIGTISDWPMRIDALLCAARTRIAEVGACASIAASACQPARLKQ